MKIRHQFVVQQVGDVHLAVTVGESVQDFSGYLTMNDSGAAISEHLRQDITREQLIDAMLSEYEAPREMMTACVDEMLDYLRSIEWLQE